MRRKAIAQSLFFSSALTLAAAAVTVQAADTAQSQPPSDSGQTMQQQATAPDTATGSPSGTAVGDDTQSATGPSAGDPATPSSSEQTAALGSQQDSATVEPIPNEDELAELSGKTVVNMEGEEIGEIDSIVRDRSDQSLKAVIRSGGFFGIGGDKVAVAAEDLQLQDDDTVRRLAPFAGPACQAHCRRRRQTPCLVNQPRSCGCRKSGSSPRGTMSVGSTPDWCNSRLCWAIGSQSRSRPAIDAARARTRHPAARC